MNKLKKILYFVPLLLMLCIIINSFYIHIQVSPTNLENVKIIFPDSSIVKPIEIAKHNLTMISVLHDYMLMDNNGFNTFENIKSQNRLFYVAILSALASLLLLNKTQNQNRNIIMIFLLGFIIAMFLLEVHREDLEKRSLIGFSLKGVAVESLVNSSANNVWYIIKADSLNALLNELNKNRFGRKLLQACNPDPEQIVFYFIPWFGIYLLWLYKLHLLTRLWLSFKESRIKE